MTSATHSSGARFLSSTGVCFLVEIPVKVGCWHQKQQFGALEYALRFSPANPVSQRHSGPYFAFLLWSSCFSLFPHVVCRPRLAFVLVLSLQVSFGLVTRSFSSFTNGRCFHGHVPIFGKFDASVFAELAWLVVEMSEDRCGELYVVQLQLHRTTNPKRGRKTRGPVMQINLAKMLSETAMSNTRTFNFLLGWCVWAPRGR